jgi:putative transposase
VVLRDNFIEYPKDAARRPLVSIMRRSAALSDQMRRSFHLRTLRFVRSQQLCYNASMDRTIVLNLNPTPPQAAALHQSMAAYTACFNTVAAEGYTAACQSGVALHHRTYYRLRAEHPTFPAQLVVSARMKATEAIKSALDRLRKGRRVSCPHASCCPIRYDQRSYWVKWDRATCSLATTQGRVELGFTVPPYAAKYSGGKVASADLICKKGKWRLHVVVSIPTPNVAPTGEVVGVDLGIVRPAVTSNHEFLGARHWRELEARIFRLRRKLQAKGTKSAKRKLRRLSGKLFRQRRDHDHVLSRRMVQATPSGGTIVLEDLRHIRSSTRHRHGQDNRVFHSWSFHQLLRFVQYKAEELGQRVALVNPRNTSRQCSRCGYVAKGNRVSQSLFCCRSCRYQLNADLNAALSIRARYLLATVGKSDGGGPASSGLMSQAA